MRNFIVEKELITKGLIDAYRKFLNTELQVEDKSKFDLVTSFDKNIEEYLMSIIKDKFPNDNILSEEFNPNTDIFERTWTIDPIDGTNNMAHSSIVYGLQVSLIENNEIVFGAIYLPNQNEMYYAIKGEGSYLNDRKMPNSHNVDINNIIISLGDFSHKSSDISENQLRIVKNLKDNVARIRMFGAACYDYTFAALGRTDGIIMITKNLWDIAPGIIICKESGMIVTNLCNEKHKFGDNGVIVSANEEVHKILVEACK